MKRRCKKLVRGIWIGLFILGGLSLVSKPLEAKAEALLPPGMIVGDDQGIKVKNDGNYLIDVRDVAPGKKWSTKITIINVEKDIPYRLTMTVSKPTLIKGNLDLSEAIKMTLIYEGQEIYKGPLSGVSKAKNLQDTAAPLDLGTFKSGDSRMLEATFELDGKKYTNRDFFTKNIVENLWQFKAVKTTLPDTKEPDQSEDGPLLSKILDRLSLPKTGEQWREALLFSCIGLFLILLILLIIKYKADKKADNSH
ncbi:hypothetical protein GIX45_07120 [Erwinia sp. CPCC 100877]|nr:hypothetical protein [Erwinia sp. CPCC 100877]